MKSIKEILEKKSAEDFQKELFDRHKYVSKEFQDYGYRIAVKLGEKKNASLYIKLAKEKPRGLMERAFQFAVDYPKARNRGKLFMWKLSELEKGKEDDADES